MTIALFFFSIYIIGRRPVHLTRDWGLKNKICKTICVFLLEFSFDNFERLAQYCRYM